LVAGIFGGDVPTYVPVEEHRVRNFIGVFAEAADGNVHIQPNVGVHDAERHGVGGAVFVADDFLGVKIINALILAGVPPEGEALLQRFPGTLEPLPEPAVEDCGFRRAVPDELARFRREFHNRALFHDHHALTVIHRDDGSVGDDVILRADVGTASGRSPFLPFLSQDIGRQGFTVKILAPLIR